MPDNPCRIAQYAWLVELGLTGVFKGCVNCQWSYLPSLCTSFSARVSSDVPTSVRTCAARR